MRVCLEMCGRAHFQSRTGPLPHPASQKILPLGGRVGERAGAVMRHGRIQKRKGLGTGLILYKATRKGFIAEEQRA